LIESEIRIGIVGSRRRDTYTDQKIVYDIVRSAVAAFSEKHIVIVSGGARGPDTFAKLAAKIYELEYKDHPVPKDTPIKNKWEFVQRAFARNRDIVIDSDIIFALVHADRKGGTENTIEHAKDLKKKFFLVDQFGRLYLSGVGWEETDGYATDDS
jgi:predicted Rossmann fold nucleotide-binding protein DprA/Smf involved in DNA uptake